MNRSGYVYINPDTFENGIFILKCSPSTLEFSSIFQKFLIHTEMSENFEFALLRMHKDSLRQTEQAWYIFMQFFWQDHFV